MNCWPSIQTLHYDGWIIRFADGLTKRSNSINPIYLSQLDINEKIDYCEQLYKSRDLPPCFKISEIVQPANLDSLLESRGYKHEFEVSVQLMKLDRFDSENDINSQIDEFGNDCWIDNYARMNEMNKDNKPILGKIIDQIILPKCLLTYNLNGIPIGCGLGVIDKNYLGLFDIVIDKDYRNRGFGKLMIKSLLSWGKNKGSDYAYLQVLNNNNPAIRLYKFFGFKEEYRYWYRIKSSG